MLKKVERETKELLELADFMEGLAPAQYRQRNFIERDLGNGQISRCICGWCNYRTGHIESDRGAAIKTLGIKGDVADRLFAGDGGARRDFISRLTGKMSPTPQDAARALRHLAVTGELPAEW